MQATARPRATNVIGAISLVLGLIISILALVAGPSYAVDTGVTSCGQVSQELNDNKVDTPNVGDSIVDTVDGADFSIVRTSEKKVTVTLDDGVSLELCIKAGGNNAQTYELSCSTDPQCVYVYDFDPSVTGNQGGGISHVSYQDASYTEEVSGWVCSEGSVQPSTADEAEQAGLTLYPSEEAAGEAEGCAPVVVSGWVCSEGSVQPSTADEAEEAGLDFYTSEEEAEADPDCAPGEEEVSAWVCSNEEVNELTTQEQIDAATVTVYETQEEAAADEGCQPAVVSAWVCQEDGEVAELTSQAEVDEAEIAGLTIHDNRGAATAECQEVQGIVDEREPDEAAPAEEEPEQLPATEVKGEQVAAGGELPNTGSEHVILGLFAGGFLMLGGAMLLLGDRRRGVIA